MKQSPGPQIPASIRERTGPRDWQESRRLDERRPSWRALSLLARNHRQRSEIAQLPAEDSSAASILPQAARHGCEREQENPRGIALPCAGSKITGNVL